MNQLQKSDHASPLQAERSRKLARLKSQIKKTGDPPREAIEQALEQMWQLREQKAKAERKQGARIPRAFYQGIINLSAGKAKKIPAQHLSRIWGHPEAIPETPEDIQDWYAKVYGDFAKPPLANLLDAVLRRGLKKDGKLIEALDEAILQGSLKWLEELTCCVALIHEIPYAGNGQARRHRTKCSVDV